jgi:hypothetical protein
MSKKSTTRKSTLGTVEGHPQLEQRLDLSENEQAQLNTLKSCRIPENQTGKLAARKGQIAFPTGIAERAALKEMSIRHLGLKWAPGFIVKNNAFKVKGPNGEIRGLYSLVAQKGAAATAQAVKEFLSRKEKEQPKKAAASKAAQPVKKAAASKKTKKATKKAAPVVTETAAPAVEATA